MTNNNTPSNQKGTNDKIIEINHRLIGKTTRGLMEFYLAGKKGLSALIRTPDGDFMTPKAVKQALQAKEKQMREQFAEYIVNCDIWTKIPHVAPIDINDIKLIILRSLEDKGCSTNTQDNN